MSAVCQRLWVYSQALNESGAVNGSERSGTFSISPCFQDTLFVWLPAVYIVAGLPYTYFSAPRTRGSVPLSPLNLTRQVLAVALVLLSFVRFGYGVYVNKNEGLSTPWYTISAPFIQALTMCVVVGVTEFERRNGVRSSVYQLVLWLAVTFVGCLTVTSQTVTSFWQVDLFGYVGTCVFYVIASVLLVLCILVDKAPKDGVIQLGDFENPDPIYSASSVARLLVLYPFRLILKGYKKTLKCEDLWDLRPEYYSKLNMNKLYSEWDKEIKRSLSSSFKKKEEEDTEGGMPLLSKGKKNLTNVSSCSDMKYSPSLLKAILRANGKHFLLTCCIKLLEVGLKFTQPVILRKIIQFVQSDESDNFMEGYLYAAILFILSVGGAIIGTFLHYCYVMWNLRLRNSIMAAVYKKSLKVTANARKDTTSGEIINLMAVDSFKYDEIIHYMYMIWVLPIEISMAIYFLWDLIGPAALAGVGVLVIMSPLKVFFAKLGRKLQKKQMKCKDERIKLTNEVISGMKVLKFYAWEKSFEAKVKELRRRELRVMLLQRIFQCVVHLVFDLGPVLFGLVSFGIFVMVSSNNLLTPEVAFVSLSYLNILRWPIQAMPFWIIGAIHANVAHKRIYKFLLSEEVDEEDVNRDEAEKGVPVSVKEGNFTWEAATDPLLQNINLRVKKASIVAIVGNVGCGKSSLLSALLGEMKKISGQVNIKGSVAYVPQLAWIQQATLKENITFGKPLDQKMYEQVVRDCALIPDLKILPGGDETEIGEKGINLSGGQKLRVSLARAAYQEADIYLLDDPLSAVDAHVGKSIFKNIIGPDGLLKEKTRIIVTHALWFLPNVDQVIVLDGGKISEHGTFTDLMGKKGQLYDLMKTYEETMTAADQNIDALSENSENIESKLDTETSYQNNNGNLLEAIPSSTKGRLQELRRYYSHDPDTKTEGNLKKSVGLINRQHSQFSSDLHGSKPTSLKTSSTMSFGSMTFYTGSCEVSKSSRLDIMHVISDVEPLQSLDAETEEQNIFSNKSKGGLVEDEKLEEGKVELSVYSSYIRAIGLLPAVVVIMLTAAMVTFDLLSVTWLSWWTDDVKRMSSDSLDKYLNSSAADNTTQHPNATVDIKATDGAVNHLNYLGIYSTFGVLQIIAAIAQVGMGGIAGLKTGKVQHERLLRSILQSPMKFFDCTPLGRIVNRFSADVSSMDGALPQHLTWLVARIMELIGTMVIIGVVTPWSLIAWCVVAVLLVLIQLLYVATQRQTMRLQSATKSPIYAHFGESLAGVCTIRAYKLQKQFLELCQEKIDKWARCRYAIVNCHRWLSMTLHCTGSVVILLTAVLMIMFKDEMSPGLIALILTQSLTINGLLQNFVAGCGHLEGEIVSVERVMQYINHEHEAEWVNDKNRPPASWPDKGVIAVKDLGVRYREGLDLVLKNISFDIKAGEKIGVVGRTGAGKSSLSLALFRIIEPANGSITIDGINVADIGLHDLRSKLTVIPQDPVLFSGTLRMNLDPFDAYTDDQVWKSLKQAHLSSWVDTLTEGLQYTCTEGGDNLSVGQRQLVCLARALLRHTKVLILDEATAACDVETDELIQSTIRSEFAGCTVFTIAHRLNTIIDYDRILVLDAGNVAELDTPSNLLSKKGSIFYTLAKDAGLVQRE